MDSRVTWLATEMVAEDATTGSVRSTQSQSLVARYQVPLFFLLAYLLSWWPLSLLHALLPHGVALAAAVVIALSAGKPGSRAFWSRLTNFRAGWLFVAAPAIIIGFKLADAASNLLAGATLVGFPQLPFAVIAIELLLLGGLWEEPGWSGYALPALQDRFAKFKYGILAATLVVGALRGVWHLPLVLVGAIPWYDGFWFTPLVFQPIISWLYNKSGGSVPLVMFFHYLSNVLFPLGPVFTGADKQTYTVLYLGLGGLAALALAWKTQFKFGWRDTAH